MKIQEWLGEDNTLGQDIWNKKYRYRDESLDEWFERVSHGDEELKQLIKERKFLFGGRALTNRGTDHAGSMFNCYSSGYAPDDVEGLMQLNKNLALTYKAQGGQGLSLTKIRPAGTPIGTDFKSDGIVPFMEIFNTTTSSISQGGARKGALMISIDIRHKEAPTFITIKSNEDKITKANLSLEIDDEFMNAVQEYYLNNKIITLHECREYNGHIVEYDVVPIELYKLMIKTVYDWGEPGCIFTNMFRNYNLMEYDDEYEIETCNPCGEQPLPKNFSCNLGSLNLSEFISEEYTKLASFNWEEFKNAVAIGVRALDTIIDENLEKHALKEQSDNSKNYRNIGLGVFGYANALFKLGIRYGSDDCILFTSQLFEKMFAYALEASAELAKEKGAFPKCKIDKILKAEILNECKAHHPEIIDKIKTYGLRNCSLLSIAPTGSIATMMGCSGGCEPEFALSYDRRTENLDEHYKVYCKSVKEYCKMTGNNPEHLPDYFITAEQVPWRERVAVQSAMQFYVDTAISSTINLPEDISLEQIEQIYLHAWSMGLKGITLFRAGCKRRGILTTGSSAVKDETELKRGEIIECSNDLIGKKDKCQTGCGSLHVNAYFDAKTGDLREVYLAKGSTGGCQNFMVGLSRMISLAARAGVSIHDIKDQLDSTGACPSYAVRSATKHDTSKGSCCPMAVGNKLMKMWEEMQNEIHTEKKEAVSVQTATPNGSVCPECGAEMIHEGGCDICKNCGYSHCG